jgi:hypothetical protein
MYCLLKINTISAMKTRRVHVVCCLVESLSPHLLLLLRLLVPENVFGIWFLYWNKTKILQICFSFTIFIFSLSLSLMWPSFIVIFDAVRFDLKAAWKNIKTNVKSGKTKQIRTYIHFVVKELWNIFARVSVLCLSNVNIKMGVSCVVDKRIQESVIPLAPW